MTAELQAVTSIAPLPAHALRRTLDPLSLPFTTTAEVEPLDTSSPPAPAASASAPS
jgi:hypothetical protein